MQHLALAGIKEDKMKKKLLYNLQLFGDEGGSEGEAGKEGGSEGAGKAEGDQGDLGPDGAGENQKNLDSLIGKAVDKALKNNDAKWQKLLDDKVAEATKKAEAYAKMTQKEREEADLERRSKELADKEAAFAQRELLVNVKDDLQEQKLPIAFADALVLIDDAEKIKDAIKSLKETWDKEISEAIKAKARQETPRDGGAVGGSQAPMDLAALAKSKRIIK